VSHGKAPSVFFWKNWYMHETPARARLMAYNGGPFWAPVICLVPSAGHSWPVLGERRSPT